MRVRLDCPLCGTTVTDGVEPAPGACPGCGARYEGGAETSQGATEALLRATGVEVPDPAALTRALFEVDGDSALGRQIAIASDQRDGFYRWWVFFLPLNGDIGTLLQRVLDSG